jgi:adenylate cyclase
VRLIELLLEVSRRMAAFDTLDEVLNALVDMTTREVGAERGSLFLNDPATNELYSRVAQGNVKREIRLLNTTGIAGKVFQQGKGVVVKDVYKDPSFNKTVDEQTGYRTKSIACAPIRTVRGEVIGVVEVLNRKGGKEAHFTPKDLKLLEAMATQASVSLQRSLLVELAEKEKAQEAEFLSVVSEISGEI